MKIITLTGFKQSGKTKLAQLWAKNGNVSYLYPYTTASKRPEDFIYLSRDKMDEKKKYENVLCTTIIKGESYVYIESQLKNDFNIIIVDDYALSEIVENYDGKVIKIWVDSSKAESSERSGHFHTRDYYDYTYDMELDDPDEFLEQLAFDVEMVQQ